MRPFVNNLIRVVMIAVVFVSARAADAQQAIDLRRTYQPGERWATEYTAALKIKSTEGPMGSYPSPGFSQEEGKFEGRVLDATVGAFRSIALSYEKVTISSQQAGARRATTITGPLSGRRLKVERRVDGDFNEEKIDVSAEGTVLTPDQEDAVRASFKSPVVPNEPVAIGASWDADNLEGLFGPTTKGRLHMQLVRVEPGAGGRNFAVVQVNGTTTTDVAAKMPSANNPGGGVDLVISAQVSGIIKIDTSNGLVASVELTGPARLEHGGSITEPLVQNADFVYRARSVPRQPEVANRSTNNPINGAVPVVAQNAKNYAGTFRNEQFTIEIRPDGAAAGSYAGTITAGEQHMTLKAKAGARELEGAFDTGGATFNFTAALEGDALRFTTDGVSHTLRRG